MISLLCMKIIYVVLPASSPQTSYIQNPVETEDHIFFQRITCRLNAVIWSAHLIRLGKIKRHKGDRSTTTIITYCKLVMKRHLPACFWVHQTKCTIRIGTSYCILFNRPIVRIDINQDQSTSKVTCISSLL